MLKHIYTHLYIVHSTAQWKANKPRQQILLEIYNTVQVVRINHFTSFWQKDLSAHSSDKVSVALSNLIVSIR